MLKFEHLKIKTALVKLSGLTNNVGEILVTFKNTYLAAVAKSRVWYPAGLVHSVRAFNCDRL